MPDYSASYILHTHIADICLNSAIMLAADGEQIEREASFCVSENISFLFVLLFSLFPLFFLAFSHRLSLPFSPIPTTNTECSSRARNALPIDVDNS